MYNWRRMSEEQRKKVLSHRMQNRRPWHSPPHFQADVPCFFHLSSACYSHAPIIGLSPERMAEFEEALLRELEANTQTIAAWCVLPTHWHALIKVADLKEVVRRMGALHGRRSRQWNKEEQTPGRKCWFACADRRIRSEAHYWATVNYIHHNPVHHGIVGKWQEWPFSSAMAWIEQTGVQEAERIWKTFPLMDYGKGWDDAGK
jgi:putative transposase